MLVFKSQSENSFHLRNVKNHKCVSFKKLTLSTVLQPSENIVSCRYRSALNISGIFHVSECGS